MDKRYQVFVSSTFEDLKDERQAVLRAVLELDHMPAGMELFPAADDDAWQLIRDVIDASDYYVLIIGGRYGSMDETGIGYTEKEYAYAIEAGKPVIPLLHENPDNLPREKTETDEPAWRRLLEFREKVENRHTCVYWDSTNDLKARVIVGLTAAVKRQPGIGWVRADRVPSESTLKEVLALRNRVAELEAESEAAQVGRPEDTDHLSQGDDRVVLSATVTVQPGAAHWETEDSSIQLEVSWNDLFAAVAPTLINEAKDSDVRDALRSFLRGRAIKSWRAIDDDERPTGSVREVSFNAANIETCLIQFRALGLITESIKQRSVRDTSTYWTLTPYGDAVMVNLRAIRKLKSDDPQG